MKTNHGTINRKDIKDPKERNINSIRSLCSLRFDTVLLLFTFACFSVCAQIQQAWVARYNNGILNGTNQAVKMALDSAGNIYVTGYSQNSNSQLGYVTIKYPPNGNQIWAARFDSTNYPSATPAGLSLDASNNVIVTGSAATVKYDANGNQLWTVPYSGTALAVDAGANIYVTGFGVNFNTVKLTPMGSNLWFSTYVDVGPTLSQVILVDSNTNIYVAGSDTYVYFSGGHYVQLAIVKYDSNGNRLWVANSGGSDDDSLQVEGAALDNASSIYLVANATYYDPYLSFKFTSNGTEYWIAGNPTANGGSYARGIASDSLGNAFVTGYDGHYYPNTPYPIGTYKIGTNGAYVWTNLYYSIPIASSVGLSIALDQANSVYVAGFSPGTNTFNDIVTIKYDNSGNQIWVQRYQSLGTGNAAGNAIAVDNNGNVYVTGYDTTPAGGTEIVTIKYSAVTIQHQSNGTILLQAQGSPGESFDVQASTDLQTWLDLGTAIADTNGLAQFDDTNAPNFDCRFYTTQPQ
jgi:hypothetical protein